MPGRFVLAILFAAALVLSPPGSALALSGDHLIVPGVRIGAALLEQADQGALVRDLGEPDRTIQRGDRAYYMYGAPDAASSDGSLSDRLTVEFDLARDAPFEISTISPAYRTPDGLGVGSAASAVRAALGAPVCEGGDATGEGVIVYGAIWFRTAQGTVTRIAIRKALRAADFKTGPIHC